MRRSRSSRPPFACGFAPMRRVARRRELAQLGDRASRPRRRAPPAGSCCSHSSSSAMCSGFVGQLGHRHLVRAPVVLGLLAVDLLRSRPALRRAQDDHRPVRPLDRCRSPAPRCWIAWISATHLRRACRPSGGASRPGRTPRRSTACSRSRRSRLSSSSRPNAGEDASGSRSCSRSGGGSAGRRRRWQG